jgi:hypothetical protein
MHDTAFLRSDELPGRAAQGYLSADARRPVRHVTYTVLSNTSEGAWPVVRHLGDTLDG